MLGGYEMNSTFRKILALLLCTALCLSLVPTAWAVTSRGEWSFVRQDTYSDAYNLHVNGCGIFALINAVGYLTGKDMGVERVAAWAVNGHGYDTSNTDAGGTDRSVFYPDAISNYGEEFGFTSNGMEGGSWYSEKLKNHLLDGGVAIGHVLRHYIAVIGYNASTGEFHVLDGYPTNARGTAAYDGDAWKRPDEFTSNMNLDWYCLLSATSYVSKCTVYPTYVTLKTTANTSIMSLPCSSGTDPKSTVLVTLSKGKTFTATEVYVNERPGFGVCWYKGHVDDTGLEGYLVSTKCEVTKYWDNAIQISKSGGYPLPTTIEEGSGYFVSWLLRSNRLKIDTVQGSIRDSNGDALSVYSGNSLKTEIDSLEYQLGSENGYEAVDSNLHFSLLPGGSYSCDVRVKCMYYYGNNSDGSLQTRLSGWITPVSFSFTKQGPTGSYLDNCEAYPTNLKVKISSHDTYFKSLPCSKDTDPNSITLEKYPIKYGQQFDVTKMYVNTKGNCWYKATYMGKEGYIFSGDTEIVNFVPNEVTTSGGNPIPKTIPKNGGYYVAWLLNSKLNIDKVQGYIYDSAGELLPDYPSQVTGVDAQTYQLGCEDGYEPVDSGLHFSTLDPGSYSCVIRVRALHYYGDENGKIKSRPDWKEPVFFSFTKEATAPSGNQVMTADQFISCLQTAAARKNKYSYNEEWYYNLGYYDGDSIYWDCWNLGKSILWSRGAIVNNYTTGNYAHVDTSFGLGDWTGLTIIQKAPNCNSDFSHLIPGEWLYLDGHMGYYIGGGQVIECTTSWGANGITQSQIDSNGYRSRNGSGGGQWLYHGMVPWIDYSAYTSGSHTHDWVFEYYWAAHPHYNSYRCSLCGEVRVDRESSNYLSNCNDCKPETPVVKVSSNTIDAGMPVTLTWNNTAHTTHYNFWLYMEYDSGDYQLVEHTMGTEEIIESPLTRTLQAGKYKAVIQAYDSAHWLSDHSDWVYTESEPVYFEVIQNTVYTISYDANGGTNAPMSQTILGGGSFIITDEIPQKPCHAFLGWAESSSAEHAEYEPGDLFAADHDTTLYAVWGDGSLSEWSEVRPTQVDDSLIQTKIEYRTRDKETVTGPDSTMDGWTLESENNTWSDYGSWSCWTSDTVEESDSRQVETATLYKYYYFLCPVCGRHEPFTGTSDCHKYNLSGNDWHETWSPIPYTESNYGTFSYTTEKYYTTSLGDGEPWCFSSGNLYDTAPGTIDATSSSPVIANGYRYRDRSLITSYTFSRWSDWSDWSSTEQTGNDDREVETRMLYRYLDESLADHEWSEWTVTTPPGTSMGGVETRICAKCGKAETRPVFLDPDFVLPASLTTIGEEAFAGGAFSYAHLPDGVTRIGKRAFADCPNLRNVDIPESATSIDPTAFAGTTDLTIHGVDGSYAEFYAGKYGFAFIPVD